MNQFYIDELNCSKLSTEECCWVFLNVKYFHLAYANASLNQNMCPLCFFYLLNKISQLHVKMLAVRQNIRPVIEINDSMSACTYQNTNFMELRFLQELIENTSRTLTDCAFSCTNISKVLCEVCF